MIASSALGTGYLSIVDVINACLAFSNADWHSVQVNGCDFGEDAEVCNGSCIFYETPVVIDHG